MEIPEMPARSSATAAQPATTGKINAAGLEAEDQRVAANWLITITTQHHESLQVGPRVLAVCCPCAFAATE